MGFSRRKKYKIAQDDQEVKQIALNQERVTQAVQDAKNSNEHFAKVLERNGITVKIFLAAGGKRKKGGSHA